MRPSRRRTSREQAELPLPAELTEDDTAFGLVTPSLFALDPPMPDDASSASMSEHTPRERRE